MKTYKLIIVLIIATLLQVCTASPVSAEDETYETKLFTEAELQRAENIGLTETQLITGKFNGLTFEEMMQIYPITKKLNSPSDYTIDAINEVCAVLVPDHRAATDYTTDQESISVDTTKLPLSKSDQVSFHRIILCSFVSQPSVYETDATTFGLTLKNYLRFRFFEWKTENTTGLDRVNMTKSTLCRIYNEDNAPNVAAQENDTDEAGQTIREVTNEFEKLWNAYQNKKTSTSFVKVCNFLGPK